MIAPTAQHPSQIMGHLNWLACVCVWEREVKQEPLCQSIIQWHELKRSKRGDAFKKRKKSKQHKLFFIFKINRDNTDVDGLQTRWLCTAHYLVTGSRCVLQTAAHIKGGKQRAKNSSLSFFFPPPPFQIFYYSSQIKKRIEIKKNLPLADEFFPVNI